MIVPLALVDEMLRRRLAGVERAVQVDADHPVPVLDVHVPHRLRARGDAGVGDHDVELAERRRAPAPTMRSTAGQSATSACTAIGAAAEALDLAPPSRAPPPRRAGS